MVFSSMVFLWIFLPVTLAGYYLLHLTKNRTLMNVWLLLVSVLFYSFGEPKYILLLLISVLINYTGGLLIEYAKTAGGRKTALFFCVVLNLALLGYFKYYQFAAELLAGLFSHAGGQVPALLLFYLTKTPPPSCNSFRDWLH